MGLGWNNKFGKGLGRDTITVELKALGLLILLNGIMVILTYFLVMSGN